MNEKQHDNSQEANGVLSSDSSVILLVKDEPPNGGLRAWLQVLGAFFMYFNTWGKYKIHIPKHLRGRIWHADGFVVFAISRYRFELWQLPDVL